MPSEQNPPRVFVSYSHDSPLHEAKVLGLSNRLRADGLDAVIDQYEPFPPKGWTHWMRHQIKEARFVLVVCTATYRRRAEGDEEAGKGLGVTYEGSIIDQELYEASGENHRFIPVVLTKDDSDHRPEFLRKYSYFAVDSGYEDLYRLLTNQPKAAKPDLGRMRALPELSRRPDYRNAAWNIPARNDFFSGRDEYIENLHKALANGGAAALTQAIRGLGGIGKTQTAIEYAHRYRAEYSAGFWMTADSRDALVSGFAALAPEGEQDLRKAALAGKRWFEENSGWLLILDNVEDWSVVKDWIPAGRRGHVLITTRLQYTGGIAKGLDLPKMTPEEGAEFLLRRAKVADAEAERAAAKEFSKEVGGLPLALEQAGAFIEEMQSSVEEYLSYYRSEGAKLRARPGETADHASVTVTYTLAFAKLSERAKDIVCMCAFLAPDAIPEEILTGGKEADLGFREAAGEAAKFSLIDRDPAAKAIDIHRLVQDVVKDGMDDGERRSWAERAVEALNAVFPDPEFRAWPQCERLLPHAKAAALLIEENGIEIGTAARLLNQTALYLKERARLQEAEPLYERALTTYEKALGRNHPYTAGCLNNLGALLFEWNRHAEAESAYRRALAVLENVRGLHHIELTPVLNNLANLYSILGRYDEAEAAHMRALTIKERSLRPDHESIATSLQNLGGVYLKQGRHGEAEVLCERALRIRSSVLGSEHPRTAMTLLNLAGLYRRQGRHRDAEPLFTRALTIFETALGPEHPDTINCRSEYAVLLRDLGREPK